MKKVVTTLLMALALTLCVSAAAAEEAPALSGTLGSDGQLSWQLEDGALSVRADQPWTGQVMAACYHSGRFSQVKVLTPGQPTAQVDGQVNLVKLFWLGEETFAPQCEAVPVPVAPDKVITDGITRWREVTYSDRHDHYVADSFAPNCAYYLNGSPVAESALREAAAKRGTVVEFYLDANGQIAVVKAYYYTVAMVEGPVTTKSLDDGAVQVQVPGVFNDFEDVDKITGWEGLAEGDVVLYYSTALPDGEMTYTIEKARKISGKVLSFYSSGALVVDGERRYFSGQDIRCVDAPISEEIFQTWNNYYNLGYEFNFFLDKNGSIAVAQQLTVPKDFDAVCLVRKVQCVNMDTEDSYLAATLVFADGGTERDSVFQLSTNSGELKRVVGRLSDDPAVAAGQITIRDAYAALTGDQSPKFFYCHSSADGYTLTKLCQGVSIGQDWEDPVSRFGPFTVTKDPVFAQGFPLTADAQTNFIIERYNADFDAVVYHVYRGVENVPEMDVSRITAIAAKDPGQPQGGSAVAKYVYLVAKRERPSGLDGYVFITDNNLQFDTDFPDGDVYLANIIDTDGSRITMRVGGDLAQAIQDDSLILGASRQCVGHLWGVKEIDDDGVVTALCGENGVVGQPVTITELRALGNDVITTAEDTWQYDNGTLFVFVELGWEDDPDDPDNQLGVREPGKDLWYMADYGAFRPAGFFNPNDVGEDKSYSSVRAAVIPDPDDPELARSVYVVREWN